MEFLLVFMLVYLILNIIDVIVFRRVIRRVMIPLPTWPGSGFYVAWKYRNGKQVL